MRWQPIIRTVALTTFSLGLTHPALSALSDHKHSRKVNLITTDYDLIDTSYIDRGRMDGIKVGDSFNVNMRSGKRVTRVVVTAVYDRMSAVKIKDSWLLKDGLRAVPVQRPYTRKFDSQDRRPAPEIAVKKASEPTNVASAPAAPAPAAPAPDAPSLPPAPAPADGGLPALPGDDGGLPALPADDGLPAMPDDPMADPMGMPGDDMALPPMGDDMALPPMDDGGMDPMGLPGDDMALPPMEDELALPPMDDGGMDPMGLPGDDMGLPPMDDGGMDVPPPPAF